MAGDMDPSKLTGFAERAVFRPALAMWTSYFRKRPNRVITVLLFNGQKSYRKWAKSLFNDTDLPYFGYYRSTDRTLVMDIQTGGGTLVHELTHALIEYDFPNVPTWVNEGLGSLHEGCLVHEDRIEGVTNWRLPGLKKELAAGTLRPLVDLVTKRDFRGPRVGSNYAQARYFFMYMQKLGKVRKFYRLYRDTFDPKKPRDVKVIEKIFGKPIDTVDLEFRAWIQTLRYRR